MKYFSFLRRDDGKQPLANPVTDQENSLSDTAYTKEVRSCLIAPRFLATGPSSPVVALSDGFNLDHNLIDGQVLITRARPAGGSTDVVEAAIRNVNLQLEANVDWTFPLQLSPICYVCSRNRIGRTSTLNRQVFWTLRHLRVSCASCDSCLMIANTMGELLHTELEDGLVCGRVEHFATDCRSLREARRLWLFTTSVDQIPSHTKQSLVPRSYLEPDQPTLKATLGCIQPFESGLSNLFSGRYVDPEKTDFSLISKWLSTCESSHNAKCGKDNHNSRGAPALRVVDVLKGCVVVAPTDCRYLALSYVQSIHT